MGREVTLRAETLTNAATQPQGRYPLMGRKATFRAEPLTINHQIGRLRHKDQREQRRSQTSYQKDKDLKVTKRRNANNHLPANQRHEVTKRRNAHNQLTNRAPTTRSKRRNANIPVINHQLIS